MLKILFVTTDDYPVFGTTSNLINKLIIDGELENKYRFGVLTLQNGRTQKAFEKYRGIRIYRIPSFGNIHTKDYIRLLKTMRPVEKIGTFIEKSIIQTYEWINPGALLYRFYNVKALKKGVEYLANGKYDVVVPICGNYDALVAVLKSSIKAKKIFWQVDPCSTNLVRLDKERKKALRIEKAFIDSFDCILTEKIYYKELIDMYPGKKNIYQFEFPLINNRTSSRIDDTYDVSKTIKCVFSGLIYLGIRDPYYTIRLFDEVSKLINTELHMVGVKKSDLSELYRNIPVCYGKVEMDTAESIVDSADYLVNIGNKMNNQIPSKLFEYISTGKPIINICKNRDCPSLELLEKYPLVINIFEEEEIFNKQVDLLKEFIITNAGKRVDYSNIEKYYNDFTPRRCASRFVEMINLIG